MAEHVRNYRGEEDPAEYAMLTRRVSEPTAIQIDQGTLTPVAEAVCAGFGDTHPFVGEAAQELDEGRILTATKFDGPGVALATMIAFPCELIRDEAGADAMAATGMTLLGTASASTVRERLEAIRVQAGFVEPMVELPNFSVGSARVRRVLPDEEAPSKGMRFCAELDVLFAGAGSHVYGWGRFEASAIVDAIQRASDFIGSVDYESAAEEGR